MHSNGAFVGIYRILIFKYAIFSGSSILDINKGVKADLSRRAVKYTMYGLSFREYLELFEGIESRTYTLEEVLEHKVDMDSSFRPLLYFRKYIEQGYYPFALEDNYKDKLMGIVTKTLETDIPEYANMNVSTGRKLKRLMAVIAESVPFKPNMVTLPSLDVRNAILAAFRKPRFYEDLCRS